MMNKLLRRKLSKNHFNNRNISKTDVIKDNIFIWLKEIEHEITNDNINEYPKFEDNIVSHRLIKYYVLFRFV